MLKNKTWVIAALFVALAMIFGCTDAGLLDDGSQPKQAEDLVIEGDDIVLEKAGTNSAAVTIDGTKVTFDGASMTSAGFYYEFPAEAAEYGEVVVYFKIISIDRGRPGLLVKNSNLSNYTGVLNDQDPQYQLNDEDLHFTVGMEFDTGKKKTSAFTGGRIAFQHQAWNPDGNGDAKYTVEVLKIVFPGDSEPPPPPVAPPAYEGNGVFYYVDDLLGEVVIDTDPSVKGEVGMTISATGVVTMTEGSVLYYKFPTSAAGFSGNPNLETDWDNIKIEYTISDVVPGDKTQLATPGVGPSDGNFKARVRDYTNLKAYTGFAGANEWPNLGAAGDRTLNTQTLGAQGSGGIAINYNWNDRNADGAISLKVKITKVTFTQGQRVPVTFISASAPFYYGTIEVLKGNSIGDDAYPKLTKTGSTFLGWSKDLTDDLTAALTYVGPGTAIDPGALADSITVYANWYVGVPADVTLSSAAQQATIFGAIVTQGTGITTNTDTFTQTGSIWALPLDVVSPIWFAAKTITFTFEYSNVSGTIGHNWKTSDPSGGDPWNGSTDTAPTEGGQYPSVANGTKAYTFNTSALFKGGLASQTSGSGSMEWKITKIELKF